MAVSERRDRIARVVEEYDLQGWHRTGTDVDRASAEWLAEKLKSVGLHPDLQRYSLARIQVDAARLDAAGMSVPGLPAFDGGFTGPGGVSGSLGTLGSDAEIGLTVVAGEEAGGQLDAARRAAGHRAIVAITEGRRPGLQARNATYFKEPFGPPVLYVGSEHRESLMALVSSRATVTITVHTERVPSESANVVAVHRRSAPTAAPLVVTTPRSGWWHCASERGGGIAAWLDVARSVAQAESTRDIWFVAFSGHELGHFGLDSFLERNPGMVEAVKVWVHFGANVGGATDSGVRVGASNEDLLKAAISALQVAGVNEVTTAPAGRVPGLEPQAINALGGRCISLLGGNAFFHLEQDRWPEAVNVESVATQAAAFTELVLRLAQDA